MSRILNLTLLLVASVITAIYLRNFLVDTNLDGTTIVPLGFGSVNFQYTTNIGINFGLGGAASNSRQLLLAGIALFLCLIIITWGLRSPQKLIPMAAGLMAGGGLSNAYERVAFGGVFDYFNFSVKAFQNPFSFNLADIYIFIGVIIFVFARTENQNPADGEHASSVGQFLLRLVCDLALTSALLVSCLYISWQILSSANFLFGNIYDRNNLEQHINQFAPQNRNKDDFASTSRSERIRIFTEISGAINSGGKGLDEILYTRSSVGKLEKFLVEEELNHLQDVANLVERLKPVGAIVATILMIFYIFCWYYMISRQKYLWRPNGLLVSAFQIILLATATVGLVFIIGPQKVFYQLHEWAFTENAQWFFYYQDSLMTTLMPEIVFADIAVLLGIVTVTLWFFITLVLRRYLI